MEPMKPIHLEEERPDWAPRLWRSTRFNRWFWRSPGRGFVWLIAVPLLAAAATVAFAVFGQGFFWVLALAVATVLNAAQAVVYAPRAWRAYRR